MDTKCFEIRDRATFIPVVAVKPVPSCEAQRYLLRRAGYSCDPTDDCILLVKLSGGRASYDPYNWGDHSRTMQIAHEFIVKNFDRLSDGAVVDVEFLLGETKSPKNSESVEFGTV